MFILKIAAVVLITVLTPVKSSGVFVPPVAPVAVPAAPALRYTLVAPQNIRPFAAQVSTFTNGLSIYAAPYAAGVLNAPAIINRAVVPGIPPVPGTVTVSPPGIVAPPPFGLPPAVPAPFAGLAARVGPPLLPGFDARSVHAVGPAAGPALAPPLPYSAALLG